MSTSKTGKFGFFGVWMATKRKPNRKNISNTQDARRVIQLNPVFIGVLISFFGLITLLSILSYDRLDLTGWSPMKDYFEGVPKNNWLGIVGANLAKAFFEFSFGYLAVIIPVWMMYTGYHLIRQSRKRVYYHPYLAFAAHVAFATSIALILPDAIESNGFVKDYYPAGLVSGLCAEIMVRFFGGYGSVIILLIYIIAVVILYFPEVLQKISIGKFKLPTIRLPKFAMKRAQQPVVNAEDDADVEVSEVEEDSTTRVIQTNRTESTVTQTPVRREVVDLSQKTDDQLESESTEPDFSQFQKTVPDQPVFKSVDAPHIQVTPKTESIPEETPESGTVAQPVNEELASDEFDLSQVKKPEPESQMKTEESAGHVKTDLPEEVESEINEPNFTIEEGVTEKQANLDKVHKRQTKRERYKFPSIDLLNDPDPDEHVEISEHELWTNAQLLEEKLADFKVDAKVVNVVAGPVITMFELRPAMGVRVGKIESLMPDIALKMAARGIRYLGQLPGKDTIGIEIPNAHPNIVYFKEIINSEKFVNSKFELPISLGKAVNGEIIISDLAKMPHLLVAGATGAGKSVGLNAIITSLLYSKHPDDLKFIMIDPKMLELGLYNKLQNHHLAYSRDLDEKVVTKPENAVAILRAAVSEMEARYKYLASVSVRNIKEFNNKVAGTKKEKDNPESELHEKLPYIVVVIDELADLMITAGKEIEEPIARLTQMARAVGIHCVIATQRPSVDVITGVIKANIPTRIAFQTATKIDSRTILDIMGAEQLLGRGDMLYLPPGQAKPQRIQNAFLDTDEIEHVLDHIKTQEFSTSLQLRCVDDTSEPDNAAGSITRKAGGTTQDDLYEDAKMAIVLNQAASISFLQRRLGIGYSRAAKLVDQLEADGVIGPPSGSNRRDVLMRVEDLDGFSNPAANEGDSNT